MITVNKLIRIRLYVVLYCIAYALDTSNDLSGQQGPTGINRGLELIFPGFLLASPSAQLYRAALQLTAM